MSKFGGETRCIMGMVKKVNRGGIPKQLNQRKFLHVCLMPRVLPTLKSWLLSTCLIHFNFNFMECFKVIILKHWINKIVRAF